MTTYHARVFLSMDFGTTCMGYDAEAPYRLAATMDVEATDPTAACEVVFEICNSYPESMAYPESHCDARYAKDVERYRALSANRSLSVGDAVQIDGVRYAVARFGFKAV